MSNKLCKKLQLQSLHLSVRDSFCKARCHRHTHEFQVGQSSARGCVLRDVPKYMYSYSTAIEFFAMFPEVLGTFKLLKKS